MSEARHTDRGKWSQAGVPHRGWTCVGIEGLEEPLQLCEMCESADIRYVYFMEHPDYPDSLGVGCICAEHMEEDYVSPRLREKKLRSKAQRRRTWPKRQWKVSYKGNPYLNAEGFNLTVFPVSDHKGRYWGLRVTHRESGHSQAGRRRYSTEDAAKRAALDALLWAKENLSE
ncbi:hypothetical protein [Limibacillus sp. MBR-115]|jgi:hypothetical protein|uniref:hypothetical protein n=1 Tax=Limibacillus sp. MBR-115 TaxID=3156465 RepID=UPI00339AB06E